LPAYRQTFRRHRALLIAPVVVAALIGGWFTFGAAPAYRSTASVWVDNNPAISSSLAGALASAALTASANDIDPSGGGAGGPSSSGTPAPVGPAGLEAVVVSELLLSPSFDVAVGRGSLLPRFVESSGSATGFSPSALLAGGSGGVPPSAVEATAAADLAPAVRAEAVGPQVLELIYDGPSPVVSRSVLQSLVRQIGVAGSAFGDSIGKTAAAYYRRKLAAATSEAAGNQGALDLYARTHPQSNSENDATYRALATEVGLAKEQLTSVQSDNSQAATEAQSSDANALMKVVDPPTLPTGPVTGLVSKLMGVVGGAFAGAVMSLLALIALTPRARRRWDAEVPLFARLAAWDATGGRARGRSAGSGAIRAARPRSEPPAQQEGGA
jgi:hypothetical protein